MMNKIFHEEIGEMLKVYIDDMIVKSVQKELHTQHLQHVFKRDQEYNIRLNLKKCTLGVRIIKFMGFYLNKLEIKANPHKCKVVVQMSAPISKKEVQKLNGMLTTLNRFMSKLV